MFELSIFFYFNLPNYIMDTLYNVIKYWNFVKIYILMNLTNFTNNFFFCFLCRTTNEEPFITPQLEKSTPLLPSNEIR